ncbi:MAG: pilus assembly protein CpaE, partial [Pseudomonadota bacterium]
ESGDPLNDINALAEVCEPGTVVIAAGQVNDVRLYRDLVVSGIQDYLLKPLSPDMLREAFTHAQTMLNAPKVADASAERPHCSTAVIGARGGVGASTIATSVAWVLSEKGKRNTALLDLDVHFGTGALTLDLEPGRGLTDAIENPSRIDGLFIERAMVKSSDTLSVLSAEAPINSPVLTDGAAFYQLQEEMRSAFECTVVDLPRNMLVLHPHLITDVQIAVVVTELTLAAARDSIRILSWLKSNAPQTQVFVVANRVHANAQLEISRKDFEGSIERRIDFLVAFDQKIAAQSAKLGKPLAEAGKGSKTVAPIVDLAMKLMGAGDAAAENAPAKKAVAKGTSLMGKFGDFKSMMPKRKK